MSVRLVGARLEVPADGLDDAVGRAAELRSRLAVAGVDVLASPVDSDRGHLWVLASPEGDDGPDAAAVRVACSSVLGQDGIVSFSATLFADDSEPEDSGRPATHALLVPFVVPEEQVDDLDGWYTEEHAPWLLSIPGWLRTRRYRVDEATGEPWNRLILHDLAGADLLTHPEVVRSMQTEWRDRFAPHAWFMAGGRSPMERF